MKNTKHLLRLTTKYAQVLELGTSERTLTSEDRKLLEQYKNILNKVNEEAWFWQKDSRAIAVINKILNGGSVSAYEKQEAIANIKNLEPTLSVDDFAAVLSRY